eukprot:8054790-Pyramimonas_sp.AAC.1
MGLVLALPRWRCRAGLWGWRWRCRVGVAAPAFASCQFMQCTEWRRSELQDLEGDDSHRVCVGVAGLALPRRRSRAARSKALLLPLAPVA